MLVAVAVAVGHILLEEAVALVAVAMELVDFQVKLEQHYREHLTLAEVVEVLVILQ
jgi:hypothetical protein